MAIHNEPHPLAGQTIAVVPKNAFEDLQTPLDFELEDWADRVIGGSWMFADGNFVAIHYAMRAGFTGLPTDNECVYGRFVESGSKAIIHTSEFVPDDLPDVYYPPDEPIDGLPYDEVDPDVTPDVTPNQEEESA